MTTTKKLNSNAFRELILVGVVLILCVIWSLLSPNFLTMSNITNILRQSSFIVVAAVGMTMVIIIGEIDLSAGSLLAVSGLIGAMVVRQTDSIALAISAAILVGAFVGFLNGVMCAKGKLPGFIATLAMMVILRGLAFIITGGNSVVWQNRTFTSIGTGFVGPIPIPVIVMLVAIVFGVFVTTKLRFGRYIYSVGGNAEASRWSGIVVDNVKIYVFTIMGILTAIAGLIVTARLGSGQPSAGSGFELDAITAVVVGGTSLSGGKGKVTGTVVGVLLLTVLTNGMTLVGINTHWQQVFKGLIIIVSVFVESRNKKMA